MLPLCYNALLQQCFVFATRLCCSNASSLSEFSAAAMVPPCHNALLRCSNAPSLPQCPAVVHASSRCSASAVAPSNGIDCDHEPYQTFLLLKLTQGLCHSSIRFMKPSTDSLLPLGWVALCLLIVFLTHFLNPPTNNVLLVCLQNKPAILKSLFQGSLLGESKI